MGRGRPINSFQSFPAWRSRFVQWGLVISGTLRLAETGNVERDGQPWQHYLGGMGHAACKSRHVRTSVHGGRGQCHRPGEQMAFRGNPAVLVVAGYNGVSPSGNWGERYSWHKQELWKGRESLLEFMGTTDWSGWRFKTTWLGTRSWSSPESNAVGNPAVFATNTVFAPTPDSITNATATRLQTDAHLARGIPALSPATGRISLSGGDDEIMPSYDMNSPTFMVNAWPRPGNTGLHGRFLHSDIKNAAFLFVHPVFERIVEIGDLAP